MVEEICLAARRTLEQFKTGRAVPSLPSLPKVGRYRGEVSLFDAMDLQEKNFEETTEL